MEHERPTARVEQAKLKVDDKVYGAAESEATHRHAASGSHLNLIWSMLLSQCRSYIVSENKTQMRT